MVDHYSPVKEIGGKKEKILLAALEMFLEKDYYQATIIEIAEKAGVGKGTVYEYYPSKEDLFKDCLSYCAQTYLKTFQDHMKKDATVKKTMHDIVLTHLELLRDNRKKMHLLFNERPLSFQQLQAWVLEQRQELLSGTMTLIQDGIRLGEIRGDLDVEMTGRLFLALNYVVMGGMVILDNIEVKEEDAAKLLDIFWNGIKN